MTFLPQAVSAETWLFKLAMLVLPDKYKLAMLDCQTRHLLHAVSLCTFKVSEFVLGWTEHTQIHRMG